MMKSIQEAIAKRQNGDKGFTLVELLVVVVILVVLAAVAVPIFLNQRAKADNAKAKTDLAGVASVLRNGQSVGALNTTFAGNVASYDSPETGEQSFRATTPLTAADGNLYWSADGSTTAWCIETTGASATTGFHITNVSNEVQDNECP